MKRAATGLAVALAGAACWVGAAAADDSRAQVEQRIQLAARLLGDSRTAQRIAASGNSQAQGHFDQGRLHQSLAEDALRRGDLAAARQAIDEALRHMGQARRMVPDAPARQAAARQRQQQMMATLERLVQAWPGAAGLNPAAEPTGPMDGDLFAALGLMSTARYFADAGRHEDAVHTLSIAERHVLAGLQHALGTREINYTPSAATPEQELQLELQRHQSLADLVPLAVNELKPRGDALALIERYGETSRALRAQALQKSQAGDPAGALVHVRNASLYLQRALQAAGLSMPLPTGAAP